MHLNRLQMVCSCNKRKAQKAFWLKTNAGKGFKGY